MLLDDGTDDDFLKDSGDRNGMGRAKFERLRYQWKSETRHGLGYGSPRDEKQESTDRATMHHGPDILS